MHIFTMYKCNFKYKIPLSDGWGLLDQVVGVVVLLGEELLMCQGTVSLAFFAEEVVVTALQGVAFRTSWQWCSPRRFLAL